MRWREPFRWLMFVSDLIAVFVSGPSPGLGPLYLLGFASASFVVAWLLFGDRLFGAEGGKLLLLSSILIVLAFVLALPVYFIRREQRRIKAASKLRAQGGGEAQ